jgi:hypothetical protein
MPGSVDRPLAVAHHVTESSLPYSTSSGRRLKSECMARLAGLLHILNGFDWPCSTAGRLVRKRGSSRPHQRERQTLRRFHIPHLEASAMAAYKPLPFPWLVFYCSSPWLSCRHLKATSMCLFSLLKSRLLVCGSRTGLPFCPYLTEWLVGGQRCGRSDADRRQSSVQTDAQKILPSVYRRPSCRSRSPCRTLARISSSLPFANRIPARLVDPLQASGMPSPPAAHPSPPPADPFARLGGANVTAQYLVEHGAQTAIRRSGQLVHAPGTHAKPEDTAYLQKRAEGFMAAGLKLA